MQPNTKKTASSPKNGIGDTQKMTHKPYAKHTRKPHATNAVKTHTHSKFIKNVLKLYKNDTQTHIKNAEKDTSNS